MESLKKICAKIRKNKTEDSYLNLIYKEGYEENNDEISDDDMPTARNRQQ